MGKFVDITNKKFGTRTVLGLCKTRNGAGRMMWNVVCDCGRCNYAKGSHFTYSEWFEIGKTIMKFSSKNNYTITPLSRNKSKTIGSVEPQLLLDNNNKNGRHSIKDTVLTRYNRTGIHKTKC